MLDEMTTSCFRWDFNLPVDNVVWLSSLQQVIFGHDFNQEIDKVTWPSALQSLTFGEMFNQPIHGLVWSDSMQQLTFGRDFNQPIDHVVRPPSLQQLTFGHNFNQSIHQVMWSSTLQVLTFGEIFNQPVHGVVFFFPFFFFNLTYSRWTSSLPSCLWSQRIFPSLPDSRLTIFYRDASSALLQLVNQWLNFPYSRSNAFRYEGKNTNPTLVRIELTTCALAGVQVTY